jgi:DDE superfamily endonuclease
VGVANVFMFAEPISGWCEVAIRESKTKGDWAIVLAELLECQYVRCEKVILVCDNLNTHTESAFHEVWRPERARSIVRRIEFHYAPKHGSWLNIAESGLSSMTRQYVQRRRISDIAALREETAVWANDVNQMQSGVDLQMKTDDAPIKLISVYPRFSGDGGLVSIILV